MDEDVNIGVIFASAPSHLISHILKSHAQVRTMLFDCCRVQAGTATGDVVPMDLSMLGKGKGKGKGKKSESNKDEKDKDKDKKGKGKGKNNAKAEYFAGHCL